MNEIKLKAYAKINLSIDVTGKRPDGYHDVIMVLQQIDLYDTVTVRSHGDIAGTPVRISSDSAEMPTGQDNIVWKAVHLIKEYCPDKARESVEIHIEKNIPMAAGLAGGSADAAAVLRGLNVLWKCDLSLSQLMEIGVKLGADVPFCIMGQAAKDNALGMSKEEASTCALAQGIGEVLTPLPPLSGCVVLSKPPIPVSTAEIYKSLDLNAIERRPDTQSLIKGLQRQDFSAVRAAMYNVLQEVSVRKYPVIAELIQLLGSIAPEAKVMMSGSGPTVFAITPDKDQALSIYNEIQLKHSNTFLVTTSLS